MIQTFRNYSYARDIWGYIILPKLLHVPRVGNIYVNSYALYLPMECPITIGTRIFIDTTNYIKYIDSGYLINC